MKKNLFICSFIWLAIIRVSSATPVEIGLKGGINFSNICGNDEATFVFANSTQTLDSSPIVGGEGGIFGEVNLIDFMSFQPEALIVMKGNQGNVNVPYYDNYYTRTYLEFPLLLKANVLTFNKLKMSLLAGPYIAFLLEFTDSYDPNQWHQYYKWTDGGLVLGLSFELENFVLEGSYEMGLTTFYNGYYFGDQIEDVRNESFIISLGYKFIKF
jgi:hypothetical protein